MAALLALGVLTTGARPVRAAGYSMSEAYIESSDGVRVHAFVYRPDPSPPRAPVVLTVTPYAGTGGNAVNQNTNPVGNPTPGPGSFGASLLERGYAWVVVSLRGYGGSGGCFDLGGAGEQADVAASIRWAGEQPWSTGRVGMIGHSYPGATGLMGLASREPALRAVVTTAPPAGYHNYFSHGVRQTGGGHGFGAVYAASDLHPPSLESPTEQHTSSLSGTAGDPACYATVPAGAYEPDQAAPYWVERDLVPKLAGTRVPTLLVQGFNDWQVRPNAVADVWAALAGPARLLLGPWDHGIGRSGTAWNDEVLAWFDEHLAEGPGTDHARVRIQSAGGEWRAEPAWPPRDAGDWALPVLPGRYVDVAGNHGETGVPQVFPVKPQPLPGGRGSWTFTPPLDRAVHASGVPRLITDVTALAPNANVVALVYDVAPDGTARFVTRGAAPARAAGAGFTLYPLDWRFPAGHRVGVLLTGSDDIWFEPSSTGAVVTVAGGTLSLPRLGHPRDETIEGPFTARRPHAPLQLDPAMVEERTAG